MVFYSDAILNPTERNTMKNQILISVILTLSVILFLNWQRSSEVGRYRLQMIDRLMIIIDTKTGDFYSPSTNTKFTFDASVYKEGSIKHN